MNRPTRWPKSPAPLPGAGTSHRSSGITSWFLVKFVLLLAIVMPGFGQDVSVSPSSSASLSLARSDVSYNHYTINDGLALTCVESAIMDSKGRIWINPCRHAARGFSFSFFQYDGTQSYFHKFQPDWVENGDEQYVWKVQGETPNGALYGASYFAEEEQDALFLWHPDHHETDFYRFEPHERLLGLSSDEQSHLYALIGKDNSYRIVSNDSGEWAEVSRVNLKINFKERFDFPYDFVVRDGKAWFLHRAEGLVRVDLDQGTVKYLAWGEIDTPVSIRIDSQAYCCGVQSWLLTDAPDGRLLLYLGPLNGFFTLDTKSIALAPLERLNQSAGFDKYPGEFYKVDFVKDNHGNLLVLSAYLHSIGFARREFDAFSAWIWNANGTWTDLTEYLETDELNLRIGRLDLPNRYFGSDFRNELGWINESGITITSLYQDLGIQRVNKSDGEVNIGDLAVGIRSINQIDDAHLLIGTDLEIIYVVDLKSGYITGRVNDADNIWPLSKLEVRGGAVWSAKRKGKLVSCEWPQKDCIEIDLGFDFEKFLFLDSTNVIISSKKGLLYQYNINTDSLVEFWPSESETQINAEVTDLLMTSDNLLWVSALNGLWQFDLNKNELQHLSNEHPLLGESIITIHEDSSQELWLGTSTNGLLIFDPVKRTIKQITRATGLSNNTVVGILSDDQGNKWASTNDGISVLDPAGEVLLSLDESNGLTNSEFNRTSYKKLPDGRLAFGGINGLNILDPDFILESLTDRDRHIVYLTDIEYYRADKDSISLRPEVDISSSPIQIPAERNYIMLDFQLSSYTDLNKHSYAYRLIPTKRRDELEGEIAWIDLGTQSKLTINNLPAGYHTIQVTGFDQHSNQASTPLEVAVKVDQFFYRTWWFYMLCALPFVVFAWIWLRRNASEKRRLEHEVDQRTAKITQQAARLKELDEAKTNFFTNISHEFRTPLTVIMGMADRIERPERAGQLIKRNARHLLTLINQILDLRKLESGDLNVRLIQGDVTTYLKYLMESFQSLAEDKDIRLIFESEPQTIVLDYDPEILLYIVFNLLSNALKFTPSGGEVKLKVIVDTAEVNGYYQFSVADTGIGIPEKDLPRIYDRFYQVTDEQNTRGGGTGVGLHLVEQLVKLRAGTIHVESQLGSGTTFTVRMPYTQDADPVDRVPSITLEEGGVPIAKPGLAEASDEMVDLPSLLVVEDNPDVREYLAINLESDYRLLFARDGIEGQKMAMENVPDIIVSDVMMPGMDGFTLCNHLKTNPITSHIPIVLLTAKADVDSRVTGLERGADAYLAKPFDKKELEAQLQNLLAIRQQLRARYAGLDLPEPTTDTATQQEDQFITGLRETILDHISDEQFGVTELCREAAMSRTQLHNKLKSLTGSPTSHFIRHVRIRKAIALMADPDLNVGEIAMEVGISNPSYFSRIFTQETGLSPTKYIDQLRAGSV